MSNLSPEQMTKLVREAYAIKFKESFPKLWIDGKKTEQELITLSWYYKIMDGMWYTETESIYLERLNGIKNCDYIILWAFENIKLPYR